MKKVSSIFRQGGLRSSPLFPGSPRQGFNFRQTVHDRPHYSRYRKASFRARNRQAELPSLDASFWCWHPEILTGTSSTMVLRETNKIRGSSQPSDEYHHLELTVIELTKSWKSYAHVFTMGSFAFSRFYKNIRPRVSSSCVRVRGSYSANR